MHQVFCPNKLEQRPVKYRYDSDLDMCMVVSEDCNINVGVDKIVRIKSNQYGSMFSMSTSEMWADSEGMDLENKLWKKGVPGEWTISTASTDSNRIAYTILNEWPTFNESLTTCR